MCAFRQQVVDYFRDRIVQFLAVVILLSSPVALSLEVGDRAPDFTLSGSDGAAHQLSTYLGERPVVLAFFPKAFTGG
jgi:peroxiredoxin Q/BCP